MEGFGMTDRFDSKEALSSILSRRSIRRFKPDPIAKETLDQILTAGTYAPTGMNRQSPIILAVTNKDLRDRLSRLNAQIMGTDGDPFYGAPTVVIVFGDSERPNYIQDASLVLGNLMLAAYAADLGSCWINRAREMFDTEEGKALKKEWGLEDKYVGVGCCILGYPDGETPAAKPRKPDYIIKIK